MSYENKKLEEMFIALKEGANTPKYQLERGTEIFFYIYLEQILKIDTSKETVIAKILEFPLKKEDNNQSTNVDFVVFTKSGENLNTYLVELKTDMKSINQTQIERYINLKEKIKRKNSLLIDELKEIRNSKSVKSDRRKRDKYDKLINKLENAKIITNKNKNGRGLDFCFNSDLKLGKIRLIYILPIDDTRINEKDFEKITFSKIIENRINGLEDQFTNAFCDLLTFIKDKEEKIK